jgi:hypothetical protein
MTKIFSGEKLMSTSDVFPKLQHAVEFVRPYAFRPDWYVEVHTIIDGPKAGQFLATASHRSFWEL